jgi:squalene-hopene/tetraprenyl-beta-curcumene cyclase
MRTSFYTRISGIAIVALFASASGSAAELGSANWSPRSAAGYLDQRINWWLNWPTAARDHDTHCVSCHTTLPFMLSRASLDSALGEKTPAPTEQSVLANVTKRVRMWKEVEPFYPDQLRGVPKTSESRGTESILNALILVWRDAPGGVLSPDARLALDNMWALQLKSPDMNGAWAWLQFHNAPWEGDSQFWGNTLAAIAIGSAPGNYKAEPAIQPGLKLLESWLQKEVWAQTPVDRVALLWASTLLPDLLTPEQQKTIVNDTLIKQKADGGFSISTMVGSWKRKDGTAIYAGSDGYATGLVAFTLEQLKRPDAQPALNRAVEWLRANQNPKDGRWAAYSLNKERSLESDAGRFMSDAATAYAVLALTHSK